MKKLDTCVILCGGKSSRMGQDKALLPFKNETTLTHYQVKKMSKIFQNVYVNAKSNKFNTNFNLITDIYLDKFSPMVAICSIFKTIKKPVFIVPVDMPFISQSTIQTISNFTNEYDIVVAKDAKHSHNLCGFFSNTIYKKAEKLCLEDIHKIKILLKECCTKEILFDNENEFLNLNFLHEYKGVVNEDI